MNEKEILNAIGDINEEYLEDARPRRKDRTPIYRTLAVAASLLLVVGISLLATLGGSGGGSGDPIKPGTQPSGFTAVVLDYLMNYEGDINNGYGDAGDSGGGDGGSSNGDYFEVTDNQIEGIVEGDLIKATDKYLFALGNHTVYIYSLEGEGSGLVSTYVIEKISGENYIPRDFDMFLSEDGNTLTLFGGYGADGSENATLGKTIVFSIDVSDVENPRETSRVTIKGSKATVRKIGDQFYLVTNWLFSQNKVDLYDPESYIPHIIHSDSTHVCDVEKIIYPEKLSSLFYRYVTILSEDDLSLADEAAVMQTGNVYFTDNHILFARGYSSQEKKGEKTVNRAYTRLGVLDMSDGLEFKGYIDFEGLTKDQYSFDEHEGMLRIVASLSDNVGYVIKYKSTSLYVYDLEDLDLVASVDSFAPDGEAATAVRFENDRLYVCTADIITYTDPVYFFDLSDYSNITYADTGFINGFSTSLIDLGEGYLLGVGTEDGQHSRVEIYRREGDSVISVDKYIVDGRIGDEYKSYLIDREQNIFGFSVGKKYQILRFDTSGLHSVCSFGNGSEYSRGFTKDGYIYYNYLDSFAAATIDGAVVAEQTNKHTVAEWTVVKEAACGQYEVLESSCSCGRLLTRESYDSSLQQHELDSGICIHCGKALGTSEMNAELVIYTPLGDGTCFVTGSKRSLIGSLVIPEYSPRGDLVVGIGKTAFLHSGLIEVTLPASVKIIDDHAFYNSNLKSINLDHVESIGRTAFYYCKQLDGITLSDGLRKIGVGAFYGCETLSEIYIPDSVTYIGEQAFGFCEAMTSVRLPAGLTSIERSVFNNCRSLESINIPSSVTFIGEYAFNMCYSLRSVTIPDGVDRLYYRSFADCRELFSVTLGSGLTLIDEDAFESCFHLTVIENRSSLPISAGAVGFGDVALYAKEVGREVNTTTETTPEGYVFYTTGDGKSYLVNYEGIQSGLILPTGYKGGEYEIAPYAFFGQNEITQVVIPEGVTAIGEGAFMRCWNLLKITLPKGIVSIGDYAFSNTEITSIELKEGLVSIGDYAFDSCNELVSIILPDGLVSIGKSAFSYCSDLVTVTIPDGVEAIEEGSFTGCSSLRLIKIPKSVTSIKDSFTGCRKLTTILYEGSEEQWKAATDGLDPAVFFSIEVKYNSDLK